MRKLLIGSLVTVAAVQFAQAQVTVDVSKITCDQFNVMQKQDSVALWLGGYYHGKKGDTLVDTNLFEDNVRKIRAACRVADNFNRLLIEVIGSQLK